MLTFQSLYFFRTATISASVIERFPRSTSSANFFSRLNSTESERLMLRGCEHPAIERRGADSCYDNHDVVRVTKARFGDATIVKMIVAVVTPPQLAPRSGKRQVLVRSVLVPESVNPPKIGGEPVVTESALLALAKDPKTVELMNVCRGMRDVWEEQLTNTATGSFRYWAERRMVYGVNVSGQLANAPEGQLDIWVRTDKLAEVSGVPEKTIKQRFSTLFSPFAAGRMDFVIRIKDIKEAETLVSQLREFATQQHKKSNVAAK